VTNGVLIGEYKDDLSENLSEALLWGVTNGVLIGEYKSQANNPTRRQGVKNGVLIGEYKGGARRGPRV
jgi:hypothetical protein